MVTTYVAIMTKSNLTKCGAEIKEFHRSYISVEHERIIERLSPSLFSYLKGVSNRTVDRKSRDRLYAVPDFEPYHFIPFLLY